MPSDQQEQHVRHGCGRWTLGLAFTLVFGLVILFHTETPSARILPLQDVVFKTAGLSTSNNVKNGKNKVSVSSDATETKKEDSFQGEGVAMSFTTSTSSGSSAKESNAVTGDESDKQEESKNTAAPQDDYLKDCSASCLTKVQQHKERWGGDLLNIQDVKLLVKQARDKLVARLRVDYGNENFENIFLVDGDTSRGRQAFLSANIEEGLSTKRFKRKLKLKILKMQAAVQAERESLKEDSRRRLLEGNDEPADHYQRFVWSTGGHSAAAGHGNLFNESYTAFMNQAVTDIFGAIGIDFEGRNMAMGGTPSGPEIALCEEAVFGVDADVISWDYGMTDANWYFRKAMYNQRAGFNPNRPAIIDLNVGGREYSIRNRINQEVEDRGLTSLYLNPAEFDAMEAAFPDTFGLTKEQTDAMPPFVRHFRCQDAVEKGEPTCREYKYTEHDICPKRKGMASWHPGW